MTEAAKITHDDSGDTFPNQLPLKVRRPLKLGRPES